MMPSDSTSSDRFLASSLFANWWPATTWFMASAMALEKFLANSPYLPSFEDLTRSRHSGPAMARISPSVFSVMFTRASARPETGFKGIATVAMLVLVPHEVIARRLLHGVFAALRIATRNRQHVPICVVHLHGVAPVVVTRPAGLLAEQCVLRDALGSAMTVLQFPRPEQLVNVLRGEALEVLLHDLELLETDIQELLVGHVAHGDAAAILVHQLLQTLQALLGIDVVRVDIARHDRIAVDPVMLHGLEDLRLAAVDLLIGDNDAFGLSVVDVFAGGLRRETAFGERPRREGVRRAADRIAGAEQPFDRRHAVVAPEILGRGNVLRARAPGARTGRVGAHDVGLGSGQLGILVLGIHIGCRPQHRLADGHAEEVFPADLFQMGILEGAHGHHVNGAAAGIHFTDYAMVA